MSLLDDLVETYFNKDLATVFTQVGIESIKITEINRQILKKVSLLNSY
ncbi:hypothetical protein [Nostoc sp. DSM 114167]|jgi:hypothetical protein